MATAVAIILDIVTPVSNLVPAFEGQKVIDTVAGKVYIAYGLTNADWQEVGSGGGITVASGSPVGVVTPTFIGEIYLDTEDGNNVFYIADAATNADWQNIGVGQEPLSGTSSPMTTVSAGFIGQIYIDTSDNHIYVARGTGFDNWVRVHSGAQTLYTFSQISVASPTLTIDVGLAKNNTYSVSENGATPTKTINFNTTNCVSGEFYDINVYLGLISPLDAVQIDGVAITITIPAGVAMMQFRSVGSGANQVTIESFDPQ